MNDTGINISDIQSEYHIPEPTRPDAILASLAFVVLVGLVGLSFPAYHAFLAASGDRMQAWFLAILTEAGIVVMAISTFKSKDKRALKIGLGWSLVVSIFYNFFQVYDFFQVYNDAGVLDWYKTIFAMVVALGPPITLLLVELSLSQQLQQHQTELEEFKKDRSVWVAQQVELIKEDDRNQRDKGEREKRNQRIREERRNASAPKIAKVPKSNPVNGTEPELIPEGAGMLPEGLKRKPTSKKDFLKMVRGGEVDLRKLKPKDIEKLMVISDSAARKWKRDAKGIQPIVATKSNGHNQNN